MKKKQSKPKVASPKGLHGAIFGSKPSKLTPASVCAQKAWQGFPVGVKKELRKTLKDHDKDGVPNGFDCRPANRKKQESFLSSDSAYLRSNKSIIVPDKYLGFGSTAVVYTVSGNPNLVIKIPHGYMDTGDSDRRNRIEIIKTCIGHLKDEYKLYTDYDLEHEALFTPTQLVQLPENDIGVGAIGLLRPYVQVIKKGTNLTDKQIEALRQQLISISKKGLVLGNGLQLGIDKSGKILLYDIGMLRKGHPDGAFWSNGETWRNFLVRIMPRKRSNYEANVQALIEEYGDLR